MKTWEKIYWGIIGVLFVLSLSPLLGSEELIKVTVNGQARLISRLAYFGYDLLGFVIIFVPIWAVVRLIVNKGWSEKGERNIGLLPDATEAERTKYTLCKSIVRYQRQNNLEEEALAKKLGINQAKLEYILFCHIDKLEVEELINHVDKLTGHLELKINYEGEKATAEAH